MYVQSYKELIVWQKSIQLVKEVYLLTEAFPKSEVYGLSSQLRRAAISVPSNIAEGHARKSDREYLHALVIAYGSALEIETQLYIARELQFIPGAETRADQLLDEVSRMLNKMTAKRRELEPKG